MANENKRPIEEQLAALGIPDDLPEVALQDAPVPDAAALARIRARTFAKAGLSSALAPPSRRPRFAVWGVAAALALALAAVAAPGAIEPQRIWETFVRFVPGFGLKLQPTEEFGREVRIPRGAGGVGFLPLLVMEKRELIEKHAAAAGIPGLKPQWVDLDGRSVVDDIPGLKARFVDLGGPSVVNDALLSGAIDFAAAGPPAFLILWDRTRDHDKVMGVSAMTSLPMYLNTIDDRLKTLDDFADSDKIAVTAVKVSIPSIAMQMYAAEKHGLPEAMRFDRFTVSMTHPDGVVALLGGSGAIAAHFTSPPFHQRERKDPRVSTIMTTNDVMKGSTTFTMLSTTTAFHEKNPKVVAAVLAALDEANRLIREDKKMAANLLLGSTTVSGFTAEELFEVVNDPDVKFTTTPENVMKYAEFMQRVGTISKAPANWQEMFFPEIHGAPGN